MHANTTRQEARKPRVYVTRRIPDAGLRLLADVCEVGVWEGDEPPPPATLARELRECDGALTLLTDRIDAALLDACPRLLPLRCCTTHRVTLPRLPVGCRTYEPGRNSSMQHDYSA